VAVNLVGSLLFGGGTAGAISEASIVLSGKESGCADLTLPKSTLDDSVGLKIETKGRYAGYALYPSDRRYKPGTSNANAQIYTRDMDDNFQFATQTKLDRRDYRVCLLTDGVSTIRLGIIGLKGTLRPRLKPDRRLNLHFYSKVLSASEAAQGFHHDLTITDNSWQVADKQLIIKGPGASLGDRAVCIQAKTTNEAFCNQPPHPYNIHYGTDDSQEFTTPVNVPPGKAKPGPYEVTYSGVEAGGPRVVITSFEVTLDQN
jgi:hypothetical protein